MELRGTRPYSPPSAASPRPAVFARGDDPRNPRCGPGGPRRGRRQAERQAEVGSPSGTQAVDRAARLLTEVVHSPGSVTFTELAAATGLAKSTTSRLLLALERNGLVRRDEAGRFRPGEMFVRF